MPKASEDEAIIDNYEEEEEEEQEETAPGDDIDSEVEEAEYDNEEEEEVDFTTTGEQLEDVEIQIGDCDFEDLDGVYTDDPTLVNSKTSISIKTTPYITKYELVKVTGLRVQMLEMHAPPTVGAELFPDGKYPHDTEAIALMELRHKRLPFIIRRPLPNGQHEDIPVSQLLIQRQSK